MKTTVLISFRQIAKRGLIMILKMMSDRNGETNLISNNYTDRRDREIVNLLRVFCEILVLRTFTFTHR